MTNSEISKKPFKLIEIAITNFKEDAVPHHINLLKEIKSIVHNDPNKIKLQENNIKRIEIQLNNLLYELDTLRTQVQDSDLDKFDTKTVPLRKNILQIINEYKELRRILTQFELYNQLHNTVETEDILISEQIQLKTSVSLEELKIKEKEACMQNIETLNNDIQELHSLYGNLNEIVHEQGEIINTIENNVEETQQNVDIGTHSIVLASRLKSTAYPLAGACLGGIIGGPLGFVAGVKFGGLAAIGGGCLGYIGGKIYKKKVCDISDHNLHSNSEIENKEINNTDCDIKKDD